MPNIYLPLAGLLFSVLFIVVFFIKERLNLWENKLYALMLIIMGIESVIATLLYYNIYINANVKVAKICGKIDFALLIIWLSAFFLYTIYVLAKNQGKLRKYFNNILGAIIVLNIGVIYLLYYSRLDITLVNVIELPLSGNSFNFFFYASGGYLLLTLIIILFCFQKVIKYYLPLLIALLLTGAIFIVTWFNPHLVLFSIGLTFINALLYLTIENPDIKKLEVTSVAMEAAEKASLTKSEFLSNMSHQIKTSLNAIKAYSELTAEANDLAETKENVIEIAKSVNVLLDTIDNVLDISSLETKSLEIINNNYDPMALINRICELIHNRLDDKEVEFKVKIDPNLPSILYGDCNHLQKILSSLLSNAVHFTDQGYIEFIINTEIKDDNCALTISVQDTGCGIRSEYQSTLFTDIKHAEVREGFGLSLIVTHKLIGLMQGQMTMQSVFGSGSKFTVTLNQLVQNAKPNPLPAFDPQKNLVSLNNEINKLKPKSFSGKKVLIVDDNKTNLKVAKKLLKNYQLTITECFSGAEALAKINAGEAFDLIFLDDFMPQMTGTEVMHELKRQDYKEPIVVLTANDLSGEKTKYLTIGFNDYLSKPIERRELDKVIHKYLSK